MSNRRRSWRAGARSMLRRGGLNRSLVRHGMRRFRKYHSRRYSK